MIKGMVLSALLFICGVIVFADDRFYLQKSTTQEGAPIMRFVSTVDRTLYCVLTTHDRTHHTDLYLHPYATSDWFYIPNRAWRAICE